MKPTSLWLLRGGAPKTQDTTRVQAVAQIVSTDFAAHEVEAQALWERAQMNAAQRAAAPASPAARSQHAVSLQAASLQALSLESLSDACSAELAARETRVEREAATNFGVIHSRLMEAVSASTEIEAPQQAAPSGLGASRRETSLAPMRRRRTRHLAFSWALAGFVAFVAGAGGHHLGRATSPRLPADKMISDFDGALKSGAPLPLLGPSSRLAASWLGRNTGMKVHLPALAKSGVRLIGARSHRMNGEPVAQTHYEQRGVRLALYQMHAPGLGLDGLDQKTVRGRSFFIRSSGAYRLVAWRNGENVLAVVSPLAMPDAVRLAEQMRDNPDANAA